MQIEELPNSQIDEFLIELRPRDLIKIEVHAEDDNCKPFHLNMIHLNVNGNKFGTNDRINYSVYWISKFIT